MKMTKDFSLAASRTATALAGAAAITLGVFLPGITRFYLQLKSEMLENYGCILAVLYAILAVGIAALITLWILLGLVDRGEVFTVRSVHCLRCLSWSCILAGLLFGVLGIWFYFSWCIAAAALFLGLILRVVKNCMEQAAAMKQENDFTI